MLYFSESKLLLNEIPNEISLSFLISGCPLNCKGCHSSITYKNDYGEELTKNKLKHLIKNNKYITNVLFLGGEWNKDYLLSLFNIIKEFNIKISLYTGLELNSISNEILNNLDYIKTGKYIEELGGLNSLITNQKLLEKKDNDWFDISHYFK